MAETFLSFNTVSRRSFTTRITFERSWTERDHHFRNAYIIDCMSADTWMTRWQSNWGRRARVLCFCTHFWWRHKKRSGAGSLILSIWICSELMMGKLGAKLMEKSWLKTKSIMANGWEKCNNLIYARYYMFVLVAIRDGL